MNGTNPSTKPTRQLPTKPGGGYNLEFVEMLPPEVICLICSFVVRKPHRMKCCGKVYCKICLDNLTKKSDRCPNCQEGAIDVSSTTYDEKSHEKVIELKVRCRNASKGCNWLGKLKELDQHCTQECSRQVVRCRYYDAGCKVKMAREEQEDHIDGDLQHHFSCALETVLKLRRSQRELRTELYKVKEAFQPRTPLAVFKMTDFSKHRASDTCWYSPSFLSHASGYKLCLRIDPNGVVASENTYMSVFLCLMQGENDSTLNWPFRGRITVELLNQLQDGSHHRGMIEFESEQYEECNSRVTCVVSGSGRGWPQFASHTNLEYNPKAERQYLKDDCLYFRIPRIDVHESNKPWLICTT